MAKDEFGGIILDDKRDEFGGIMLPDTAPAPWDRDWHDTPVPQSPKKNQSFVDSISEFGLDLGKRMAGAVVGGVASIPLGLEKGAQAAVRGAVTGGAETVMPGSVYMPGLDSDEAIFGPETTAQKLARSIAGERAASAVPPIPFAQGLSDAGAKGRHAINASTSAETQKSVANSQVTGNIFKGQMDFGKDPSVRGYVMQAADVFGSMLPVVATALITKNPNAGAVVGGAMAGGEGANSAQEFVAKKTDSELQAQSPFFAKMIEAGASPAEARKLTMDRASESAAALQGLVASVGDKFTGKLVTGQLDGLLAKVGGKSAVSKTVGGGLLSSGEEGLQEVGEGLASDIGIASVVPSKEIGENSAANLVLGALGGAPVGAGRGLYAGVQEGRQPTTPPPVAPPNQPTAPTIAAREAASPAAKTPDTTAAEKALLTPVALTSLDRVNEIDQNAAALSTRADELNRPDSDYGPMFDQERAELAGQQQALAAERAELAKDWPQSVPGLPSSFTTEAGARVNANYALMDAADLITSHDEGLRKNPLYPPELQPRERDRAASEMQVSGIVQKLDPARLGLSADAANGAPIVGADGLVESGNARTIALKRVYQANGQKAEDYKQFLRDNAAQFGLTPESIDGLAKPVLVRLRTTPVNRAEFARQANASTVAQMSPSEQAKSDANRIDGMEDLAPDDNGDFSNAASRPFVQRFMARLPITEQAGMVDANGDLSTTGYARVRNAVLAKAYGDSPVLARMTESMDDNLRNVSRAFMLAAPKVAAMRSAIKAGNRFDADITPDLMSASEELARIKTEGGSVQDALAQTDLMGDQRTPEARQLLQFFNDNMRRPRRMADFIGAYMDALDAAGDPNQGSLLGDTQAPAKQDLLTAAQKATQHEVQDGGPKNAGADAKTRAPAQRQPEDAQSGGRSAEADGGSLRREGAANDGGQSGKGWLAFPGSTGTLRIPRAEMPQVKAEHRGALISFLQGQGIEQQSGERDPADLKPTQAEFSPAKVEKFQQASTKGERSVLVSSDGYVLDGHHQWLAHLADKAPVKVIEFDAPIRELLAKVAEFPSVGAAEGTTTLSGRDAVAQDFKDALADLAQIATRHTRVAMVPENTPELMPTLVKLMTAGIKEVGYELRDLVKYVKEALKADARFKTFWNKIGNETYKKAALLAMESNPDSGDLFGQLSSPNHGGLFDSMNHVAPVQNVADKADSVLIDGKEHSLDAGRFGLKPWPKTLPNDSVLLQDTSKKDSSSVVLYEGFEMPRETMRNLIVDEFFTGVTAPPGRKPVAYVMGGGGASGKGTILGDLQRKGVVPSSNAVIIDPDEVKRDIPEYKEIVTAGDSRAANIVHEESSALAKQVLARAIDGKFDLVYDVTMGNPDKGIKLLQNLKDAGYDVHLFGVAMDPRVAVLRADARARKKGRYVSIQDQLAAHKRFPIAFGDYAEIADSATLYENSGAERIKVAEKKVGSGLEKTGIVDGITGNGYDVVVKRSEAIDEKSRTLRTIGGAAPILLFREGSSGVDQGTGSAGNASRSEKQSLSEPDISGTRNQGSSQGEVNVTPSNGTTGDQGQGAGSVQTTDGQGRTEPVRDGSGRPNINGDGGPDAIPTTQREVGQAGPDGVRGQNEDGSGAEQGNRNGDRSGVPAEGQDSITPRTATQIARDIAKANPDGDVMELREQAKKAIIDELGQKALQFMGQVSFMRGDDLTQAIHDGIYAAVREYAGSMPVPVHESDIPRETSNRAYAGTSHNPEQRGASARREYVRTMADAWKQAERAAKGDPEALQRVTEAMRGLVDGYRLRYLEALGAHSRVMSSMIAGPAKFPVESNRKKSDTADRRAQDANEFLHKGIARMIRAARAPIDNSPESELARTRSNLDEREKLQTQMKAVNAALRKGDDQALLDMGLSDAAIADMKKPDFAGRVGFPDYKLTNNNSEIRRLRKRLSDAEQRVEESASGPVETVRQGVRVEENAQDDRLRLFFDEKPGEEVRSDLKSSGFKWSPKAGAWQRQLTDNARSAGNRVLDKHYPALDSGTANLSRGTGGGMEVAPLQAMADKIKKRMPNMPKVNVLASPADAPKALRDYIEKQGAMNDVDGALHNGELYLFASGLPDVLRAEHVLAEHEAGHFGLRAVLGDRLESTMRAIYNNNAAVRQAATELQKRGKLTNAEATEEVIVDMPSSQLIKLQGWRKLVLNARDWFADHGFDNIADKLTSWIDGNLSDQQRSDLFVANLVLSARSYMKGKLSARGEVRAGTMLSGTLAEDIAKQEKWLATEARSRGYKDIDQLADKNYPLFEKLAELWRQKNPAENGMLLSRDASLLKRQFDATAEKYGGQKAYTAAKSADQTALTYEQWVQVRTPNFMQWWGYDWTKGLENGQSTQGVAGREAEPAKGRDQSSTDAGIAGGRKDTGGVPEIHPVIARGLPFVHPKTGEPLVFFHGTRDTFTAFDVDHPNKKDAGWLGRGHYVINDRWIAETYSRMKAGRGEPHVMDLFVRPSNPFMMLPEQKMKIARYSPEQLGRFTARLQDAGYRSAMVMFDDGAVEVAVFDANSLKSATGNTGAFGESNDILLSRAPTSQTAAERADAIIQTKDNGDFDGSNSGTRRSRSGLERDPAPVDPRDASPLQKAKTKALSLVSPEALDQLMYDYTDKYIDLKRIRDHIKAIGGTITDLNDAYLGEELYHKRLSKRVEDFLEDEVKPLLADLRARGVGAEEFEQFLHARHAPEANKAMAARNPTQAQIDAGEASAEAVVKALQVQLQGAVARGAAIVAIEKSLTLAKEEGFRWVGAQAFQGTEEERLSLSGMTDAQAQAVMDGLSPGRLKHMQALAARVDAINAKTMDALADYGLMDQASLSEWRKAYQFYIPLHRDEAHPDSTSHPIGQGFSVKGDASKRRTGSNAKVTNILGHIAMQREAALTRGEKNTVVKKLYVMAAQNPDADLWSVDGVPTITQVDKKSGFARTYPDPMYKNKPNVVMVRIAGRDAAIVFNERNPQGVRLAGAMKNMDVGDLGAVLTQTARVTRWFAAVNTQYNPVFGLVNFARDIQAAMLNLSTTPLAGQQAKVAKGVPAALRAVYRVERGKTPSSAEGAKWAALWEDLQEIGGVTGYRDLYPDANERALALIKELQKMDQGQVSRAAHAVVDWLSDYNNAIENGVRLSAYRAALDHGMSRERAASLAKNLTVNFNRKGAQTRTIGALYAFFNAAIQGNMRMFETLRGPTGKKIMFGGVALGMITTMVGMAVMGGSGGEDDEWESIPEFVKARAIVIPLGRKDYIAIPMPLGFHVLPNFGRLLAEWAMGGPDKSLGKQVGKMLGMLTESFNPVGGGSDIGQVIMPTAMDPLLALWRNKDWTGRPIYREDSNSMDPTPGFTRAKDSASTPGKLFAEAINKISGGSEYRPGLMSPTPDQFDYVIGQLTGGLGRELLKLNQVLTTPFTGDELPAHKVPVLGRFYGNTRGSGAQSGAFYENVRTLNEVENEVQGRNKNNDDADGYRAREPLTKLIGEGNGREKIVRNLRKQRKQEMRDEKPGYKDRVKEINTQIEEEMRALNRAVSRVKNGVAVE